MTVAATAAVQGVSRSMVFMASWLLRYAPEVVPDIDAGKLKLTPTYQRVRREHELAFFRTLIAEKTTTDQGNGGPGR